jgi:hypothetical protein
MGEIDAEYGILLNISFTSLCSNRSGATEETRLKQRFMPIQMR